MTVCGLYAQTSSAPPTSEELGKAFVRRFSAGATITVVPLPMIPDGTSTVDTTTPPVSALYTTTAKSKMFGYGVTAQVAITNHFAVNASLFVRNAGYTMDSDVYEGTLVPNLPDTRRHTVSHEDTHARFYELPVVVRWYNKDRHTAGTRWFAEGGAAARRVTDIRTSISTSINGSASTCCDTTPAKPAHDTIRGILAGFGLQLIDPIGIRVVPEVRYTRWNGDIFNSYSTNMNNNQIEGMLSLTF